MAIGLAGASAAGATTIVRPDGKGRPITFDVRAPGVDVDWYAGVVRRTLHGDEIESAVIRIVPGPRMRPFCGRGAASCYRGDWRGGTLTVAAGRSPVVAAMLRHEYAHHLDATYDLTLSGSSESRAAAWWRARRIDSRLRRREVARSTELGWERSIGEIFAEDFMRLHMRSAYRIRWLEPPGAAVLSSLRSDIRRALPTYG